MEETESSSHPQSVMARMINIFAAPGEVFDDIRRFPVSHQTWIWPFLIACLAGVIATVVTLSDPSVQQQLRELQDQRLDQLVAEGKLTEESRAQAEAAMERFGGGALQSVAASAGGVLWTGFLLFGMALILKIVAKFVFKRRMSYMKGVEIVGITGMIGALESIVRMLLVVIVGDLYATPSPSLFLSNFDPGNKVHQMLTTLNVMSIWYLTVLGVGIARISYVSLGKACAWIFGLWFCFRLAYIIVT